MGSTTASAITATSTTAGTAEGAAAHPAGSGQAAAGTAPPQPVAAQVDRFIRDSFVELFLSQSRRAQLGLLAVALMVMVIWTGQAPGAHPWWWLAVASAVTLWRIRFTERFVQGAGAERATGRIVAVLALNGVVMALPLLQFARLSEVQQAAMTLLLIALATGAVASTAGYRRVFLAFAAPMLVPLAVAWVTTPHPGEDRATVIGVSLLILVYMGFLISVARQQSDAFEASCRIRFAEQALNARLQRALESETEANRSKTQFLAAASHDLRQPIHSMNVLVAALQMRELEPKAKEIAHLLGQVNQILSAQLDALLDVSRLDAGAVKVTRSPQRLDRLLAVHHRTMAAGTALQRGLRCTLDVDEALTVNTDPALLMRVVGNLTDNAMKYNRQGGEVRVRAWREGDQACVSVADTGIGIALGEQAKVFREFYQVENVERDRTRGLGLGLSIVQRLGALLDIKVSLASTPGVGTTVTLRMPLQGQEPQTAAVRTEVSPEGSTEVATESVADKAAEKAAEGVATGAEDSTPAAGETATAALDGLRVLVVDDEAQVRTSMQLLLEQLGCTVFTADGTSQARRVAETETLDAVLTDMRLRAGDDGLQVLRTLQPLQPGALYALITGDTAPERIRQAEDAGVPLLHKPVPLSRLKALLADARPPGP